MKNGGNVYQDAKLIIWMYATYVMFTAAFHHIVVHRHVVTIEIHLVITQEINTTCITSDAPHLVFEVPKKPTNKCCKM